MVVEPLYTGTPHPQEAVDRLVLSLDGEEFPLTEEDVNVL